MMKQSRRRHGATETSRGAPAWMATYGDMVTLVLCFFVLLYSMSTLDARKFDLAVMSLQGTFGILHGGRSEVVEERQVPIEVPDPEPMVYDWQQLDDVRARLEQAIGDNDMVELVSVELEERGLVVRFADGVLFDLGSADLKTESVEILAAVAEILATIPNQVRVEGHTDDLPINTERFPSNWELSTSRATSVVRYLIEEHELDPGDLSAAGYGEYRPIADNSTYDGRRRNRRVDVVILHLANRRQEPTARGMDLE